MEIIETQELEPKNQEFGPQKKQFRARFVAKYPDVNIDDEEAYFGKLNEENDSYDKDKEKLQQYIDSEKKLGEAFDSDPRTAGLFLELTQQGGKPLEYIIDHYGAEFADLINDPTNSEFREKLAKKQAEELRRMADSADLEKKAAANLEDTLNALQEAGDELGLSPEELAKVFTEFMDFTDDLIEDKVSKDWWMIIAKGLSRDNDVEKALMEGEARGRNMSIKEKLGREKANPMNMASGGGMPANRPKPKSPFEQEEPWYKKV